MGIKNIFKSFYKRVVNIHDSPQKVALGFALGIFSGILPGVGPVVAFALASFFRINTIAAVSGSLLTNTWLSLVTFVLAVKVGAAVTGADWQKISQDTKDLLEDLPPKNLLDVSILKILYPMFVGYILIGLVLAAVTYVLVLTIFKLKKARSR